MRRVLVIVLLVLAACGSSPPAGKKTAKKNKPPPGKVGAACTSKEPIGQGTCAKDLLCAPMPGGYCTAFCPCGEGAACVDSPRIGEWCAKTCASDADCRGKDGYVCDPQWNACVLPAMVAPRAPVCETPPPELAKKTFGAAEALSSKDSPGAFQIEPAAALTKKGDLVAVYISIAGMGKPNTLGSATVSTKGGVVGDNEVKWDRENYYDPWLASDRAGKLYLTWLGFDGGRAPEKRMQVGLSTSEDGVTWSAPVAAFDANVDCPGEKPGCLDKPIVVAGPDRADNKKDALYVFYYANHAEALKMVRSSDGGATWSESVKVGTGAFADALVSSTGKLYAVYVAGGGAPLGDTANAVEFTSSADGGASFATAVKISADGESIPFYFSSPQVIADLKNAILYVVYTSGTADGKWNVVLAASRDGGASWERTNVNDDAGGCANHMMPAAAVDDATGKVHVIWLDNRTGTGALAYASCAAGRKDVKCSANERVSDVPFAAYGFARHAAKWLGDYNTLVIDAKRKTLHAVWTQTLDEAGTPTARILHATGKLK